MQTSPILNVSSETGQFAGASGSASPKAAMESVFEAMFKTKIKGIRENGKAPVAAPPPGQSEDSAREKTAAAGVETPLYLLVQSVDTPAILSAGSPGGREPAGGAVQAAAVSEMPASSMVGAETTGKSENTVARVAGSLMSSSQPGGAELPPAESGAGEVSSGAIDRPMPESVAPRSQAPTHEASGDGAAPLRPRPEAGDSAVAEAPAAVVGQQRPRGTHGIKAGGDKTFQRLAEMPDPSQTDTHAIASSPSKAVVNSSQDRVEVSGLGMRGVDAAAPATQSAPVEKSSDAPGAAEQPIRALHPATRAVETVCVQQSGCGSDGPAQQEENMKPKRTAGFATVISRLADDPAGDRHAVRDPEGGAATADPSAVSAAMPDARKPGQQSSMEPRATGDDAAPAGRFKLGDSSHENPLLVSESRLISRPGEAAIHIELQAGALGSVELRAHMSGNRLNASIATEHDAARALLASGLPALHNTLAERDVCIDVLQVTHGPAVLTGGAHFGDSGERQSAHRFDKPLRLSGRPSLAACDGWAELPDAGGGRARLSVLA